MSKSGKPTKVPYRADADDKKASTTAPATWAAFDVALRAAQLRPEDDGVGFVFAESGGIFGIDLDNVFDDEGNLEPFAQDIVNRVCSYTEISPSGRGLHVFARGRLPAGRRKVEWSHADGRKIGIEIYEWGRFFTVTGVRFCEATATIEERTDEIASIHAEYLSDRAYAARREKKGRHESLVSEAVRLRKDGADPSLIHAKIARLNESFAEPKPAEEVARIQAWAADHVDPDSPEMIEFRRLVEVGNDAANARFFARLAQDQLLYNVTQRAWLAYDGARWDRDGSIGVMRVAKFAARRMLQIANTIEHDESRQKAVSYAVRAGGRRALEAMIELAKSELPAVADDFDSDPFVLNVKNGTLDLRTSELRPHSPSDRLTKLAPVPYDPSAVAPRWARFLDEVFLGRQDLIDYIHRLAGYLLTGGVSEHVLPIPYGTGANGKTVFLRILQKLLGDYASTADVSLFLARREHGATPELARLKGVRFVAASEMPEGGRLSENLVKSLTGGDRIAARHLYGEFFEFTPTAKFMIATNYKPVVRGDDDGIWRRLKLLPFDASFRGVDRDPQLADALETELPGILRWAVDGCRKWQSGGLADPRPVVAAMAEYRSDSDAIGAFLADCCTVRDGCEVRATQLGSEYKAWCEASNERALPVRVFRTKIRERGFGERKSHGVAIFIGLGLRDTRESAA